MARYFEVSVRYDKTMENGLIRKVTERYLTEALSLTEAEATVTEKIASYISGYYFATLAKETRIAEAVGDVTCGKFYLAKVGFVTIDERTAKEKRTIAQIIVGAESFNEAYTALRRHMEGVISDWELVSLAETAYVDLF